MTTLLEARKALLKVTSSAKEHGFGPMGRASIAAVADYLENQIPLNVENQNLRERLARAEGAILNIHALTFVEKLVIDAKRNPPTVNPTPAPQQESCVSGWYKDAKCECIACRVRANA